jgi:hypothetical protein
MASSGVHHGIGRGDALGADLLVGVQQQDAIFCDDADNHDEPHERGDIEGNVCDQKGEDHARDG